MTNAPDDAPSTRVLLSFSDAYAALARRLAEDLRRAGIEVHFDQWLGGGGIPGRRAIDHDLAGMTGVIVLLTPSESAPTWIGEEWRRAVYDPAEALGIRVFPVRGEWCTIPDYFDERSFADLCHRGYDLELDRLVQSVRELSGDSRIALPGDRLEIVDPLSPGMPVLPVELELGSDIARSIGEDGRDRFVHEMVPMMQDGLFYELGVPFPGVELRVVEELPPATARVLINAVPEIQVELHPGWVMVSDVAEAMRARGFEARPAVNPANGNACAWIPARDRDAAARGGLMVWDETQFLVLTISALLRRKAADFIDSNATRVMLEKLALAFPFLTSQIGAAVSDFVLSDVLRRLVAEGVSIRNLPAIVMAVAEWIDVESDPLYLAEHARTALRREITYRLSRGRNEINVFLLDPELEATIAGAIRHTPTGAYLDLPPERLRSILEVIRAAVTELGEGVQLPAILTVMEIRAAVQRLVALSMPLLHVTSFHELRPDTSIQPLGRISLAGIQMRRRFTVVPSWSDDAGVPGSDLADGSNSIHPDLDAQMRAQVYGSQFRLGGQKAH